MKVRIHRSRVRAWPGAAVLASCIGFVATANAGLPVEGATTSGMAFRGTLVPTREERLVINQGETGQSMHLGIPLASVATLSIGPEAVLRQDPISEMDALRRLMPYWDRRTLVRLQACLEDLCREKRWRRAWRLSSMMAEKAADPGIRKEAQLLKARTLLEMGLFGELKALLTVINISYPPLESPVALCWLNARIRLRDGHVAEALFWSGLPALRIPAEPSDLGRQCQALHKELKKDNPGIIPMTKT